MKDGLRFVDCDMHIMEPPDLLPRYLDPKFKDRVSVPVGADGKPDGVGDPEPPSGAARFATRSRHSTQRRMLTAPGRMSTVNGSPPAAGSSPSDSPSAPTGTGASVPSYRPATVTRVPRITLTAASATWAPS